MYYSVQPFNSIGRKANNLPARTYFQKSQEILLKAGAIISAGFTSILRTGDGHSKDTLTTLAVCQDLCPSVPVAAL